MDSNRNNGRFTFKSNFRTPAAIKPRSLDTGNFAEFNSDHDSDGEESDDLDTSDKKKRKFNQQNKLKRSRAREYSDKENDSEQELSEQENRNTNEKISVLKANSKYFAGDMHTEL